MDQSPCEANSCPANQEIYILRTSKRWVYGNLPVDLSWARIIQPTPSYPSSKFSNPMQKGWLGTQRNIPEYGGLHICCWERFVKIQWEITSFISSSLPFHLFSYISCKSISKPNCRKSRKTQNFAIWRRYWELGQSCITQTHSKTV